MKKTDTWELGPEELKEAVFNWLRDYGAEDAPYNMEGLQWVFHAMVDRETSRQHVIADTTWVMVTRTEGETR